MPEDCFWYSSTLCLCRPQKRFEKENLNLFSVLRQHLPEKVFLNTHMKLAKGLAEAGRHEEVLSYLKQIDLEKTFVGNVSFLGVFLDKVST